jgi:3-oxoacyl-[acyl-carrier protein] reductase
MEHSSSRFTNQIVVITGGTRGIGAALTTAFLNEGAQVIATYVGNEQKAHEFVEGLSEQNKARVHLRRFDVSKSEEVKAFFQDLDENFQGLDVLVNNSGIRRDNLLASMSDEDWRRVLEINLDGSFFMAREAVLRMMKKRSGRIINMSSIGGTLGLSGQVNYAASKAAQLAMTKVLSKEVGKRGITVNCVAPGFIETELIGDLDQSLVDEYKKQVPMKRFGRPEEVAACVLFLASKEASYVTGTSLEVTGGL